VETGQAQQKLKRRLTSWGKPHGQIAHEEEFFLPFFRHRIAKSREHDLVSSEGRTFKIAPEIQKSWDKNHKFYLILTANTLAQAATSIWPLAESSVAPFIETRREEIVENHQRFEKISRVLGQLVLETTLKPVTGTSTEQLCARARYWCESFRQSETYLRLEWFQKLFSPSVPLSDFEWELFVEEYCLDKKDIHEKAFHQALLEEFLLMLDPLFELNFSDLIPAEFKLHPKKTVHVHYEKGKPPWIESYIQDFFGRTSHPALAQGRLPLTLHLLGPHTRALQITSDLPNFWKQHYPILRKELSREYPRFNWPEHPSEAEPMLRRPR
jgi:hypothetical protein